MSVLRKLKALYRQLPPTEISCNGCVECCTTPCVPWSVPEVECVAHNTGKYPALQEGTGACSFLGPSGCTIYEYRPFMCRLFGTCDVKGYFHCTHGLRTTTPLMEDKVNELLEKYRALVKITGGTILPIGSERYVNDLTKLTNEKVHVLQDPVKLREQGIRGLHKLRMLKAAIAGATI